MDIENALKEMIADYSSAIISVDFAKAVLNELAELRAYKEAAENQEPVAWGAVYFGGKYRGQLYSHTPSEEQIEDYIARVHRSDDSITLRKIPLYAKPVPAAKPAPEHKGWYCAQCQCGVDPSEVTYNEAHTVCGRIITDDEPPVRSDRPASRQDIIDVLLATRGQSEGVTADAILGLFDKPAVAVPDGFREIVEAVANIGVDFGYGNFALSQEHIEKARALLEAAPSHSQQSVHPDDIAVDQFADVMKHKLAKARDKGRSGWENPSLCKVSDLAAMLADHLPKGDPVDVANFAMMLFFREGGNDALKDVCKFINSQQGAPAVAVPDDMLLISRESLERVRDTLEFWINREDRSGMSESDYKTWLSLGHRSKGMTILREALANRTSDTDRCPSHESEQGGTV